jgi:lysine 2,3-aminomutase
MSARAPRLALAGGWQRQLKDAVTTVAELGRLLELTPEERAGAERAEALGLPLRITPYYLALCDRHDPACPIRRQVVPRVEESDVAPGDLEDPLGENAHQAAPALVQRYPDRALLLATDQCAIYCRFCTRSRLVGGGLGPTPEAELDAALAYIAENAALREVIVSGGDPLAMSTARIARLLERIRAVPHVEIIRLATRVPVCLPERVDAELLAALRPHHPIWVMTHFNHPKELTPEAMGACARLADAGFPVMNQSVLLRGVNDDAGVLERLFRGLLRARVRPYYLLQMDPVRGTAHLRTPLAKAVALMEALQGRVSGIALPKLVVDTHRGVTGEYLDPPPASR